MMILSFTLAIVLNLISTLILLLKHDPHWSLVDNPRLHHRTHIIGVLLTRDLAVVRPSLKRQVRAKLSVQLHSPP